ncbi:MAG: hypothetical protein NY202_04555 [Mollicutes bacterium UO1]
MFNSYSETDKNGQTVNSGQYNIATIALKENDRIESGKIVNERTNLILKIKCLE